MCIMAAIQRNSLAVMCSVSKQIQCNPKSESELSVIRNSDNILTHPVSSFFPGSHSLEFLSTGHLQPGDRPQFEQLTVFDVVPISHCNSSTIREELKPALESADLPEYCGLAQSDIIVAVHEIPPSINCTVCKFLTCWSSWLTFLRLHVISHRNFVLSLKFLMTCSWLIQPLAVPVI